MGAIGTIRKHSWIAVAIVGIAIVAFIIGDLTKNQNMGRADLAKINGATFTINRFNELTETAEANYKRQQGVDQVPNDVEWQLREQVWQNMVEDTLMGAEYAKMGLKVTEDEEEAMLFTDGPFTHPYMRQMFTDPKTGAYNLQAVNYYMKDNFDKLEPGMQQELSQLRSEIKKDRMMQKYTSLIGAGFYMPTAIAQKVYDLGVNHSDVLVAMASYQNVAEENGNPTEEDYEKYFKEHYAEIEMRMGLRAYDEIRKLEFIAYPVVPTMGDMQDIENEVMAAWGSFQEVPEDELAFFVNSESVVNYDSAYVKASQLAAPMDSLVPAVGEGGFVTPRMVGDKWVMAKVQKVVARPDSLRASMVMVLNGDAKVEGITRDDAQAKLIADTVEALLKAKDANVEEIVARYSEDPQKGDNHGDTEWVLDGALGFLNEDVVNTPVGGVFTMKRPDNLGYMIVKVTGKTTPNRKYRVAQIVKDIVPSQATNNTVYNTANKFAGENRTNAAMNASAQSQNLQVRESMTTMMMNQLQGVQNARSIIQWAYEKKTKIGDVADQVFECGDMYIVASLKEVYQRGKLTIDQVRGDIEPLVRLEKKSEYLMAQAGEAAKATKDINVLATKLNTTVDTVEHVGFNDYYFGRFGMEPKVQASIATNKGNNLIGPIKGANGVYMVQVYNTQKEEAGDVATMRASMEREYGQKARMASQVLKNKAKIVDMRNKFF